MKVDERPDDPVVYVMVDCEASGMIPGLYNLVSVGAVPVVFDGTRHRVLDNELYLEFKPVFPGFSREAMAIHGITRRHLEKNGVDPKAGMKILRSWAQDLRRSERDQLVFVGHNAPFDWSYISYYFGWCKLRNPFGYKALDTKALAMGKLGIPWLATNKGLLTEMLPGVEPEDRSQKHRADYDARYQAQILAALLDYRPGAARKNKVAPQKRSAKKPVAGKPVAGKPVAGKPVAKKPVAGKPVAGKPVAGKPVAKKPVAGKPVAGKPVAGKPVAGKPVAGKPVARKRVRRTP